MSLALTAMPPRVAATAPSRQSHAKRARKAHSLDDARNRIHRTPPSPSPSEVGDKGRSRALRQVGRG
jgi:hypothetical protein